MTQSCPAAVGGGVVNAGHRAPAGHLPSHDRLLHTVPQAPVDLRRERHGRPDAIIVPSARPASILAGIIERAAAVESTVVVLCSGQAGIDRVAERIAHVPGARGIVVQVDKGYELPELTLETSTPAFTGLAAGRSTDLSVKRNIGLLLARMHGWRKIAFVDDDVTVSAHDLVRLGRQLDHYQIAGMTCPDYPDNSVFCHARRLAGMPQDVFVTGAVLGVNCSDLPLPFFGDVYNEDWFFFAEAAGRHRLTKVGEARQAEYDPFARTSRASHEEFGDLMAEGLYALIESQRSFNDFRHPDGFFASVATVATEKYWSTYIDVRRSDLIETWWKLDDMNDGGLANDAVPAALRSLDAADTRYIDKVDPITPQHCVAFLEALQRDTARWNVIYQNANTLRSTEDAMKRLGIETWTPVRRDP